MRLVKVCHYQVTIVRTSHLGLVQAPCSLHPPPAPPLNWSAIPAHHAHRSSFNLRNSLLQFKRGIAHQQHTLPCQAAPHFLANHSQDVSTKASPVVSWNSVCEFVGAWHSFLLFWYQTNGRASARGCRIRFSQRQILYSATNLLRQPSSQACSTTLSMLQVQSACQPPLLQTLAPKCLPQSLAAIQPCKRAVPHNSWINISIAQPACNLRILPATFTEQSSHAPGFPLALGSLSAHVMSCIRVRPSNVLAPDCPMRWPHTLLRLT